MYFFVIFSRYKSLLLVYKGKKNNKLKHILSTLKCECLENTTKATNRNMLGCHWRLSMHSEGPKNFTPQVETEQEDSTCDINMHWF